MKLDMTITEALAEIKTIRARITTKQQQIVAYLYRDAKLRDPMEKEGGSPEYINRERQAIADLQKRTVDIRLAIQDANMKTQLELNGRKMSVYEWLIWRREVAPTLTQQLSEMWASIQQARTRAQASGYNVVAAAAAVQGNSETKEFIVNINEMELAKYREEVTKDLGDLDGRLSLINATTTI